jgi:deazaflavin-dependent oxidoreductase (nitroreductase family)
MVIMTPYVAKPNWLVVKVFNPLVSLMTRRGLRVMNARVLAVRGRKTGEWRRTPVHLLEVDGREYIVAPRGHVQWTHNMRAAGGGEFQVGKHVTKFFVEEVADPVKPPLLRAYMREYKQLEFFRGAGPDSSDAELLGIAPDHPVFRVVEAA